MRIRQPALRRIELCLGRRSCIAVDERHRPARVSSARSTENALTEAPHGKKMTNRTLTPCEAEVMNAIWPLGAATVQDVVDAIPRPLAYTTVMTTMKILEEKGFVKRGEKRGRAYVYRALISS